jgi:uncharacterized protein involved in type VI secretion and phage assembly
MKEDNCVKKYHGKYRGTVVNNIDPEQRGRVQAIVPDVSGIVPSSWAEPSLPVGGPQTGMFTVPQFGAGVWIEFEQGNPDYPIWTGCYWGNTAEVPALAKMIPPGVSGVALQTTLQNGIVVTDVPGPTGGIMLKSATGAMIIVNDTGIYIQNGKGASIVMTGPTVTINNGALVIT